MFKIFVAITLLEIYILASVGSVIGGLSTMLLVVITAFIGFFLLKQQGWAIMIKAQNSVKNGQTPDFEIFEGVVILISGVLLLTPGFLTDTIGIFGLLPFFRKYFIHKILSKNSDLIFAQKNTVFINKIHPNKKNKDLDDAIEGEFWEE